MKQKLVAVGVFFSMCVYPEVWVRLFGTRAFSEGLALIKNLIVLGK